MVSGKDIGETRLAASAGWREACRHGPYTGPPLIFSGSMFMAKDAR
jgi:hypothetical protein